MATLLRRLQTYLKLDSDVITNPKDGHIYDTPSGIQVGSRSLLSGTRNSDGSVGLSNPSREAIGAGLGRWGAHAVMRQTANGAAAGQANYTFNTQWQALSKYYGYRLIFANYGTSPLTVDLCKAAGTPTDLHNGVGLTWATGNPNLVVPSGADAGAGAGKDFVPGLNATDLIIQSSVDRTDFPTENPLLQARTLFTTAGMQPSINPPTNAELFSGHGWRFGGAVSAGDHVTTIDAQTLVRANSWLQPVGVDFYYEKSTVSIIDCADSLFRGRNTNQDAEGFNALAHRVCAIKRAGNSNKIWAPSSFSTSGQFHKASMLTAKQIAAVLKPDYLLVRNTSVNTSNTQANMDESWALLVDLAETCRRNSVQLVIGTTGGATGNVEPALGRLRAQNARLMVLRNAGAIVVDIVPIAYDPTTGLPLPGATADGVHYLEAYHQATAVAFANAIPG